MKCYFCNSIIILINEIMTTKQRLENNFICAYCNKTYVRKSSYNTHLVKCKLCRFASDCGNNKSVNTINFTNSSSEHVNTESLTNDSVNSESANNANSSAINIDLLKRI